jgi:hypothetical protein
VLLHYFRWHWYGQCRYQQTTTTPLKPETTRAADPVSV